MNTLLNAEIANARSADIGRNLKRHRPAEPATTAATQPAGNRLILRMAAALRPLRHA